MGMQAYLVALAAISLGQSIAPPDKSLQEQQFQKLWQDDFTWKFAELPAAGAVHSFRVPYSGYIYPDQYGGTADALAKYDRAFNRQLLASSYELRDAKAYKEPVPGLFGSLFAVSRIPDWVGHCNGWAAAAIRHAEPQHSVVRNGVEFSPSEIKGLLAEIYVYNEHVVLTGENVAVNAGTFHAILGNWIGHKKHPLGLEADPGEEKWNYPAFSYAAAYSKRSDRLIEVNLNLAYAKDSNGEWDESPRRKGVKFFHYLLSLNEAGEITGGRFFNDGSTIDMLWVPLRPKASGTPGNEIGNPHLNVNQVLSIWRESVPKELRSKWITVDPATEDAVPLDLVIEDQPAHEETDAAGGQNAGDGTADAGQHATPSTSTTSAARANRAYGGITDAGAPVTVENLTAENGLPPTSQPPRLQRPVVRADVSGLSDFVEFPGERD